MCDTVDYECKHELCLPSCRQYWCILPRRWGCATLWICWWPTDVHWCWSEVQGVGRQCLWMTSLAACERSALWQLFPSTTTPPPWCYRESWRNPLRRRPVRRGGRWEGGGREEGREREGEKEGGERKGEGREWRVKKGLSDVQVCHQRLSSLLLIFLL